MRSEDLPALRAFLNGLSPEDRQMRWFTGAADIEAAADWSADVDRRERDGVLATAGDGAVVGHAAWARLGPDRAEVAFEVAGAMQDHGLATILLAHIAFGARAQGIATLVAEVLPENHAMLGVFRDSGLPLLVRSEPGVLVVEMPSAFTPQARAAFDRRESIAAVAAMDAVLRPRSIAVVGASPDPASIGGAVFANLLAAGYTGALHAVNRRGRSIDGHPCHRSIEELPEGIEAAVLASPAAGVVEAARACAARGVRVLVVLSAGFGETGPEGAALQHKLLSTCRAGRMRLIVPNCLGVLNTDADVRLNASFAPTAPPPGGLGLLSQSGSVGIALLEQARALGIGLSAFVSVGNKADLSGNDFLQGCEQDDRRGQGRAQPRRRARGRLAHRRAARRLGARRRRPVPSGGRAASGDPRRAVRPCDAARAPAAGRRTSRRDRHERWRTGDPLRQWQRRVSSCSSGRRPTRCSGLSSRAALAGRRSSCCTTSPCDSHR